MKGEYAYGPAVQLPDTTVGTFSEALLSKATKNAWVVISMKNGWKRFSHLRSGPNPNRRGDGKPTCVWVKVYRPKSWVLGNFPSGRSTSKLPETPFFTRFGRKL